MAFVSPIDDFITEKTLLVVSYASNISSAIMPLVIAGMVLYVTVKGLLIIRGDIDEPIMDLAYLFIKWSIILTFIDNVSLVGDLVVRGIPNFISSALGNDGDVTGLLTGIENQIAESRAAVSEYYNRLANEAGSANFGLTALKFSITGGMYSALITVLGAIIVALILIPYTFVSLIFAILVLVAPIYISFLMFEITRGYFQPWISLVITNGVILLLVSSVAVMICDFISNSLIQLGAGGAMAGVAIGVGVLIGTFMGSSVLGLILNAGVVILYKFLGQAVSSNVGKAMGSVTKSGYSAGAGAYRAASSAGGALSGSGNMSLGYSGSGGSRTEVVREVVVENKGDNAPKHTV